MAHRDGPYAVCFLGDALHHIGEHLLRRRMRRILQPQHRLAAVVVAHIADESNGRAGRFMIDQPLVFDQRDGLRGQQGTSDGHTHT